MRKKKTLTTEQKAYAAEYAKKLRKNNPEKAKESSKKTRENNREKIRERQRIWLENNQEKHNENAKVWYSDNKERARNNYLIRMFGITLDEYNIILANQDNKCAICGDDNGGSVRRFSVDHDHENGNVRGLLCRGCNVGIGNLKDDVEILEKAIEYIRKHKKECERIGKYKNAVEYMNSRKKFKMIK